MSLSDDSSNSNDGLPFSGITNEKKNDDGAAIRAATIADLVDPAVKDATNYIDQVEFTLLLQDNGNPIGDNNGIKTKCPKQTFEFADRRYKEVWKLANLLRKLYFSKKWKNSP